MASQTLTILRLKFRIADNYLRNVKKHILVHLAVGLAITSTLLVGGGALLYMVFDFLLRQEVFGPPLVERLLGMVLMAFFSMLVFSNLIITLTTTYISKEVEFFLGQPLSYRQVFTLKLGESVLYSSWAFLLLSLPIFVSFGAARHADSSFYGGVVLLIVPFTIIPGALGALITMVLSAYFPARKTRTLSIVLAVVVIALVVIMVRLVGGREMMRQTAQVDFMRIMSFLTVGTIPVFPNYWLAQGTLALADGRWGDFLYWLAMLASTALMSVQACLWLIEPLYYRGWSLARESSSQVEIKGGRSVLDWIGERLPVRTSSDRAMIVKDMKTFCRDPAQWTQLIILFSLLAIYIASVRNAGTNTSGIDLLLPKWRLILSFLNMGGTCFILSIFTTRFVYPMPSLEGKQYWIIGLAPIGRTRLLWEKYVLCWFVSFVLAEALMVFSNLLLRVDPFIMGLSTVTILLISFGLTSLSIGFGAMTPNFKEDNPARIANGLGGTVCVLVSLLYLGTIIALEVPVAMHIFLRGVPVLENCFSCTVVACFAGFAVVNAAAIVLPMYYGLRHWRRIEF
jgi:ABC-2 type transport system permease protein